MNYEPILENASIFRNKKLEAVGLKKRASEIDLTDPECHDA